MNRYEEKVIEYQDYEVAKSYWPTPDDEGPEDDLVSQHKPTLEKKVSITTWSWWLQSIKIPTEAYYREFDNFKNTYLCNLVWWKAPNP
ncbi:13782_t:CDS:2, partial [Gigaspora margarita]